MGKYKKPPNAQELAMLGLCCRAGCLAATLSPASNNPMCRGALEGPKLAADLLSDGLLLREDPQAEICLLVWLKCGWDKDVITRWQLESVGYFPQIDVGFAPGLGGVVPEEVFAQVSISARALGGEKKAVLHWPGCAESYNHTFPNQRAKFSLAQLLPQAVILTLIPSPRCLHQFSSHLMARTPYHCPFLPRRQSQSTLGHCLPT